MRILHCIPTLELGGTQRQLSHLAPELGRMGHDVHVVLLEEGPNAYRLESSGVTIHRLSAYGHYDPRIMQQLLSLIRWLKPDILQTWILQMDILGGLASRIARIPWVLREPSSAPAWPSTFKNELRSWVARRASAIVSNSAGGDTYWQSRKTTAIRVIIPNGVPLDEIERSAPAPLVEFGIEPIQDVILYAGRFDPAKNIDVLMAALQEVVASSSSVAILCGEGSMRHEAERQVAQSIVAERFFFPGYVAKVWPLMKRANVFVSVSHFEGRPNAVIEAMACGCPLVVSDIPAHREFLDEKSAVLVNPHDPRAIAAAIVRSLSIRSEAKAMALEARKTVAEWSVPSVARQYEQLYISILADRKIPLGKGI